MRTRDDPRCGYVGEWHSHPAPQPPSATDRGALSAIVRQDRKPVALVVLALTREGEVTSTASSGVRAGRAAPRSRSPRLRGCHRDQAALRHRRSLPQQGDCASRIVLGHPRCHGPPHDPGDQGEADWVGLIRDFLPTRYAVGPIFAVDHHGNMSEQIDVAVYDTHYSPQWFGAAERHSLRACGERLRGLRGEARVQHHLPRVRAGQGGERAGRLERTSQSVVHKGGSYKPRVRSR